MKKLFKIDILRNKSTTYMLPFVGEQVGFAFDNFLLNSYLSFEEGDDIFCVMYQWNHTVEFKKFEGELMNNHLYIGHTDYGDKVVYKFRLSLNMKDGKKAFIEGRYGDFTPFHKGCIMNNLQRIGAPNSLKIAQILNKKSKVSSLPPIMEKEILSNHVKELVFNPDDFR